MSEDKKPNRKKLIIILLIVGAVLAYKSGRLDGVLERLGFPANEVEVEEVPEETLTVDVNSTDSQAE
tara:strand:- start:899 stop:1099 length:201 start_codon:yes stop_codon:yes gene_type:complete